MTKKKKNKTKVYKNIQKFFVNDSSLCSMFNSTERDCSKKRMKKFMKQRENYGFDARETWNFDFTSVLWLYSHLERFKAWGGQVIQLYGESANTYTVKVIKKNENGYIYSKNGTDIIFKKEKKTLSEGEVIELILEYFNVFLEYYDSVDEILEKEDLAFCLAQEGIKLYAKILRSLWW